MVGFKKIWSFIIGLILSISLVWWLFTISLFVQHIDAGGVKLYDMALCFKDSQIPCRWVPGLENSYGSPIFNYSAPLPFYLGGFIFLVTNNLSASVKILFSISLIGCYIFMFLFASKFFMRSKTYLFAIFYILFSFSLMILSKEGLGIIWGLMIFPLILFSLKLLSQEKNMKNFLFSSISSAILILSSDIAFILIGLLSFWIIYQYIRFKSFAFLLLSLFSIVFAFFLSAFYIFPTFLERNFVHSVSLNHPLRFLPKAAVEKSRLASDSAYQILTGDSDIPNFKQGTNWMKFDANTKSHTIIRLSQHYFPEWKIFIDGKEIKFDYKNNSLGLMTIILGTGKHAVEARLYDTPVRSASNMITIAAAILALLLFISQFTKVRHWIDYYIKRMH